MANRRRSASAPSKVHITRTTLECLNGDYEVEPGFGHERHAFLQKHRIETYFIVPSHRRKVCTFTSRRSWDASDLGVATFPDLSRSDPVRHQTGQEDEVQDGLLPAGAADALSQDVQG